MLKDIVVIQKDTCGQFSIGIYGPESGQYGGRCISWGLED